MEGIQRLAQMLEGQKDKYLITIVNHLMLQTELNQAFLNEEKNLKDMAQYIKDKAKKQAKGGVAVIEDETVYKWAKEYFIKTNEELKLKKRETKKAESLEKVENNKTEDEFGSIFNFDDDSKNKTSTEMPKKEIEQISLFAA